MKNYLLSSRCARQLLKMPRQLVNREEQGKLIAQTNGAVSMINESNYIVRSKSGYNKYLYRHMQPNRDGHVHVLLDIDFPEIFKYEVDRNAPLPTGEAVNQLIHEAYPDDHS